MDKPSGRARRHDPTPQHRRESSQGRNSHPHSVASRTTNHNDHESGESGSRARQSQPNALPGGLSFGDAVALSKMAPAGGTKNNLSASPSPRSKNETNVKRDKSKTPPSKLDLDTRTSARAVVSAFTPPASKQEDDVRKNSSATMSNKSSRQEERKEKGQHIKGNNANYEPSPRDSPIVSRRSDDEGRHTKHRRGSKSASNTPKTKRRERSASRPRDAK
ncbi:hypothetical protein EGW08_015308, partial [Elysia chlorotica]